MSEERTNMAIRDLKHYVIDNMSLDVQDDFEIICKYITSLQQKVEQLENIRKEAIQWIDEHDYYSGSSDIYYFSDFTPSNDLLNILNKGEKK